MDASKDSVCDDFKDSDQQLYQEIQILLSFCNSLDKKLAIGFNETSKKVILEHLVEKKLLFSPRENEYQLGIPRGRIYADAMEFARNSRVSLQEAVTYYKRILFHPELLEKNSP